MEQANILLLFMIINSPWNSFDVVMISMRMWWSLSAGWVSTRFGYLSFSWSDEQEKSVAFQAWEFVSQNRSDRATPRKGIIVDCSTVWTKMQRKSYRNCHYKRTNKVEDLRQCFLLVTRQVPGNSLCHQSTTPAFTPKHFTREMLQKRQEPVIRGKVPRDFILREPTWSVCRGRFGMYLKNFKAFRYTIG